MVQQIAMFFLTFVLGAGIGVFYFGGLWWTVQRVTGVKYPALLAISSFFVRSLLVAVVFYGIVYYGHWGLLLAALGGFTVTRFAIVRRIRQPLAP